MSMLLFKRALLLLAGTAGFAGGAFAQSTTSFDVSITITASCDFSTTVAATNVAFGAHDRGSSGPIDAAGALVVDCTATTPYTIALDSGSHSTSATASADNRRMRLGTGDDYIAYGLFQNSARTTVWGDGTSAFEGTGNGEGQSVPVYGRVPGGALNVPAGTYLDAVTATLTF